jgi:hypothetical protein
LLLEVILNFRPTVVFEPHGGLRDARLLPKVRHEAERWYNSRLKAALVPGM